MTILQPQQQQVKIKPEQQQQQIINVADSGRVSGAIAEEQRLHIPHKLRAEQSCFHDQQRRGGQ